MDGKPGQLSAATFTYHHTVIHRILEEAYKQELINKNIAGLVEVPVPDQRKMMKKST